MRKLSVMLLALTLAACSHAVTEVQLEKAEAICSDKGGLVSLSSTGASNTVRIQCANALIFLHTN